MSNIEFKPGMSIEIPQTASEARKLIKALRSPDGGQITTVTMGDGREVSIDDAPDASVIELAQDFARALNRAAAH